MFAVKVLQKQAICKRNEVKHIMSERNVLLKNVQHPFLVGLHYSFQTPDKLYFVLDYVNGGEVCIMIIRQPITLTYQMPKFCISCGCVSDNCQNEDKVLHFRSSNFGNQTLLTKRSALHHFLTAAVSGLRVHFRILFCIRETFRMLI